MYIYSVTEVVNPDEDHPELNRLGNVTDITLVPDLLRRLGRMKRRQGYGPMWSTPVEPLTITERQHQEFVKNASRIRLFETRHGYLYMEKEQVHTDIPEELHAAVFAILQADPVALDALRDTLCK